MLFRSDINMSKYYIIAFNKKIGLITPNNDRLHVNYDQLTKLEFLDSVTSKYSEDSMRTDFSKRGIIEDYDTPMCIVEFNPNSPSDPIKTYEIITEGQTTLIPNDKFFFFKEYQKLAQNYILDFIKNNLH